MAALLRYREAASCKPTYEGLKAAAATAGVAVPTSCKPTYEGLKGQAHKAQLARRQSCKPTYEGLKVQEYGTSTQRAAWLQAYL